MTDLVVQTTVASPGATAVTLTFTLLPRSRATSFNLALTARLIFLPSASHR